MGDVAIDTPAFLRRAKSVLDAWKNADLKDEYQLLADRDAIVIVQGTADEEAHTIKTTTLHLWLLGYEFPSTLIVITRKGFLFLTSGSKAKLLEPLQKNKEGIEIKVLRRTKDEDENKRLWDQVWEYINGAGKRIGAFAKDKVKGKFADEFDRVYSEVKTKAGYEDGKDVGSAFASIWASKDEEEIKICRTAAKMTSAMFTNFFNELGTILDERKKVTHEKLADRLEGRLDDQSMWKKVKGLEGAELNMADWCYHPIIQSGGNFDLSVGASSDSNRLEGADGGVVMAAMGLKYKSYCSNMGRTWLIDGHKTQTRTLGILLDLHNEIATKLLRPGQTGKDIYEAAVKFLEAKDKSLVPKLTKTLGYAMGIEFRDSAYLISAKGGRVIQPNMIYCISIGLADLDDPKKSGKKYALSFIDTVRVGSDPETPVVCLTTPLKGPSDFLLTSVDEASDEDDADDVNGGNGKSSPLKSKVTAGGKVLRNSGRNEAASESLAKRIKEHQRQLMEQKHEDGLNRFESNEGEANPDMRKTFKKFESYKRGELMPPKTQDLRIIVDARAQSVIMPVCGVAVPFHINCVKNVTKSEEGNYTYLRFNFISPGQIAGRKEDVPFEDPDATFIRSMSYRSPDAFRFTEIMREVMDMKKAAQKREAEQREMADVVEQDKLILNKGRVHALQEVFPRPALDGKRLPGDLELHQNGLRFTSPNRDQRIELLFSNMKHLFFQPCEKELYVILHVHLKAPIMIGKKKAKDIQFYREVTDATFDETGNRKRKRWTGGIGDEDEIELEQEERRRRAQLNKEFKHFAQRISDASEGRIIVDIPFRDLGFGGVPFRTNVLMQPTQECLVHLSEAPFLVVTLADVEIVHLERVQYGLKNFDMVFIFSDFTKTPVHINSIPIGSLDNVKEWLDSVDIVVTEGQVNLNWNAIMKTVNEDPYSFFVDGGWSFLKSGSDDENSDSSDAESGSDFGAEVGEAALDSDFDEESDDDESEFGDSEDEDESDAYDSEEDEGEDWDELERKAAKADSKRAAEGTGYDSAEERRSSSKKKSSSSNGKARR
ncbi:FACT complex subunit spt16 [Tilletia horrida]|uniref:FACT complex subunit n=1 Tax=Tilletia horrida TaxID=155126 RepID=A0AAN6JKM1_9BASI|nr:FACT complex subunit spt16 [Tilletia horrida]KAK0531544.1 FACT complex subunit spt16 [Tilletia horrida]KAK0538011.1 FACT complex subunit spt16 [Tilletia horrida]